VEMIVHFLPAPFCQAAWQLVLVAMTTFIVKLDGEKRNEVCFYSREL